MEGLLYDVKEDPKMDKGILFTTTDYYEKKILSEMDDYGLTQQIIARRGQYLAIVVGR